VDYEDPVVIKILLVGKENNSSTHISDNYSYLHYQIELKDIKKL